MTSCEAIIAQRYTCEVLRSANARYNVHIERLICQKKNFRKHDEALREHASLSVATVFRLFIDLLMWPHSCLRHFPGIRFSLAWSYKVTANMMITYYEFLSIKTVRT